MKINITLDEKSIDAALKQLNDYKADLRRKMRAVCNKLAYIGFDIMNVRYGTADYAGTNNIEVRVTQDRKKAIITARGQNVAFIEFGTGVTYDFPEHGEKAGIPPHGTYGQHRGATGKPWLYKGEQGTLGMPAKGRDDLYWTYGNPAANAIPAAMIAMENAVKDVVKEVFQSDRSGE